MGTFFGFLLFWVGFMVTATGTPMAAVRSRYRETGVMSVITFFMLSGALLMGSAGVNFLYVPPSITSWPLAIILWVILIISITIAAAKPPFVKNTQEDAKPPD
jgi:hypothetical protein